VPTHSTAPHTPTHLFATVRNPDPSQRQRSHRRPVLSTNKLPADTFHHTQHTDSSLFTGPKT
jgi:hypothetical protein